MSSREELEQEQESRIKNATFEVDQINVLIETMEDLYELGEEPRFKRFLNFVKEHYVRSHALMMATSKTNDIFQTRGESAAYMTIYKWRDAIEDKLKELKKKRSEILQSVHDPEEEYDSNPENEEMER